MTNPVQQIRVDHGRVCLQLVTMRGTIWQWMSPQEAMALAAQLDRAATHALPTPNLGSGYEA